MEKKEDILKTKYFKIHNVTDLKENKIFNISF